MIGVGSAANPLAGSELATFVAAVEAGSVHGAADALQLTQSAATKRIQALERRLGATLLERGRFGVRATELGRVVYPLAKRALEALESVAEGVERSRAQRSSDLRLSASHTIGEFLLPGWLGEFRRAHPTVRPQLEIVNSVGAIQAIADGESEIGFIEGPEDPHGVEVMTIAHDEIVLVVAAGHPWARRHSIALRDLATEAYLTREAASGTRAAAAAALAQAGVELTPALQAASAQSLKRALADGGFTLISRLTIEAEVRAGTLVELPMRGVEVPRDLRAIRRRRGSPSPAAAAFWRWLGEQGS
jgi:DNA-binding transcriptional LysR family regulator